jgi:tetratricopeptide (TPR) repeat protein
VTCPTIAATLALLVALRFAPAMADPAAALERGVARFQAGDFAAAIEPLTFAHASDPSDLDTALLLGIAYYRVEDAARARPLLLAAARSEDAGTRDSAQMFLGLIADAAGDAAAARGYYNLVARSSGGLAASAQGLLDSGRGERLAALVVVRPELDSNVPLLPATTAAVGGGSSDTDLFVLADVRARPFADVALVIDEALSYRQQARLAAYDLGSSVSSATWSHRDPTYRAALGYHLEASMLGGARYQLAHTADASGRRAIAGPLGIAASYQLTVRSFFPAAYAGYTGTTHTGAARLSWVTPDRELELGYVLAREQTDDATLSATAGGGQLAARFGLGHGADLRLLALVSDRRYDAASMGRRDVQVRADASLYVDLSPHLGGVIGGSLLHDVSNVMDQGYTKWTGYLGVVVTTSP